MSDPNQKARTCGVAIKVAPRAETRAIIPPKDAREAELEKIKRLLYHLIDRVEALKSN